MSGRDVFDKWCGQHPKCRGCKFRGNECTAPEAPHKFDDWVNEMRRIIKVEMENERL